MLTNQEIKTLAREKGDSVSLRLDKFSVLEKNSKKKELEAVIDLHRKSKFKRIPAFLPDGAKTFFVRLGGNLIVNQAGGVLENAGLCLHRHFNDPYIPGSAVKGIARHAAWCEWFTEQDIDKRMEIARKIATVFGYPTGDSKGLDAELSGVIPDASKGQIAFLAAVPAEKPVLELDIVNCHHMKYYKADNVNAQALDCEEPNPQFFPVVKAGAIFRFTLVPLGNTAFMDDAVRWLKDAIENRGAGAKTASGYGWFTEDLEYTETLRRREEIRHQVEAERIAEEVRAKAEAAAKAKLLEDARNNALLSPAARIEKEIGELPEMDFIRQLGFPIPSDKVNAFCKRLGTDASLWEKTKKSLLSQKKQNQIREIRNKAKAIGVTLS